MKFITSFFLFISVFLVFHSNTNAGSVIYSDKLVGYEINTNTLVVQDAEFDRMSTTTSWTTEFKNCEVGAYVYFNFTGDQLDKFNFVNPWNTSITVEVTAYDLNNISVGTRAIQLDLSLAGQHKDGYYLGPYHKVVIVPQLGLPNPLSWGGSAKGFELEGEIRVERNRAMNFVDAPAINHTSAPVYLANNEVELRWDFILGAELYELEWVFVDDQAATGTPDFSNATRIETDKNFYEMNLVYPAGKVYYRVRGVGQHLTTCSSRLAGAWSNDASDYITIANDFNGELVASPTYNRNWQYGGNYTEDGKRNEVLTFFDASLRQRQSLTVSDADETAIVSETMYDFEGRPAVTTLPIPTTSANNHGDLLFYTQFNKDVVGGIYDKMDFDVSTNYLNASGTISSGEGSNYYSGNNPKKAQGFNAYLPESDGYTYSRTMYGMHGKIRKQSIPGEAHKLGSGHQQDFFYGNPFQEQVERLFGAEAGNAKFYTMDVVKDANGQYTIGYKDMHDNVVASCLAGETPKKEDQVTPMLKNLAEENPIVSSLDQLNEYTETDEAWTIRHELFVTFPADYVFTYTLNSSAFASCEPKDFNCTYDLVFNVYDECNQKVAVNNGWLLDGTSQGSTELINKTQELVFTAVTPQKEYKFTVNFPEVGTYRIEKTLKLNEAAFREKLNDYITGLPPCAVQDPISVSFLTNDCDGTGTCLQRCREYVRMDLGIDSASNTSAYNSAVGACQLTCEASSAADDPCEGYWDVMAVHMSAGGQYFDNLNANSSAADNNWLIAHVGATPSASGATFTPPLANDSWDYMRDHWTDDWTEEMVAFHPEFCHYQWCKTYPTNTAFDNDLISMTCTAVNAYISGGTFNDNGFLTGEDPYFQGVATTYFNAMLNKMGNGYTDPNPPYGNVSMFKYAEIVTGFTWDASCVSSTNDIIWAKFVSLYAEEKRNVIRLEKSSSTPGCYYLYEADAPPDYIADARPSGNNAMDNMAQDFGYIFTDYVPFGATGGPAITSPDQATISFDDFNANNECEQIASCVVLLAGAGGTVGTVTVNGVTITSPGFTFLTATTDVQRATELVSNINSVLTTPNYLATNKGGSSAQITIYAEPGTGAGPNTYAVAVTGTAFTLNPVSTPSMQMAGGVNLDPNCRVFKNCLCETFELMITDPANSSWTTELLKNQGIAALMNGVLTDNGEIASIDHSDVSTWRSNCMSSLGNDEGQSPEIWDPVTETFGQTVPTLLRCWERSDCEEDNKDIADYHQHALRSAQILEAIRQFEADYKAHCLRKPTDGALQEHMEVEFQNKEYQYTLYYYDLVGNTSRTIAPEGFEDQSGSNPNAHKFKTTYRYNTQNQLIYKVTPEEYEPSNTFPIVPFGPLAQTQNGATEYFYNKKGQLRFSRNSKQRHDRDAVLHPAYSYTKYDEAGRIVEVGESRQQFQQQDIIQGSTYGIYGSSESDYFLAPAGFGNEQSFPSTDIEERSITFYDETINTTVNDLFENGQQHLRGRVASMVIQNTYNADPKVYDYATHFSYDAHGNVSTVIQESRTNTLYGVIPGINLHTVDYEYDLLSGNVTKVIFEKGRPQMFMHQYTYDANNRIVDVQTSRDGILWDTDGSYEYYHHGPLARTEIGEYKVQAIDYAYTLNGWLKGINADVFSGSYKHRDMGKDGVADGATGSYDPAKPDLHQYVGANIYNYSLGYFNHSAYEDYEPIGVAAATDRPFSKGQTIPATAGYYGESANLYNGNISRMNTNLPLPGGHALGYSSNIRGASFDYDQLHRITKMTSHVNIDKANNQWPNTTDPNYTDYQMEIGTSGGSPTNGYDKNGNILSLTRKAYVNGAIGNNMDALQYTYTAGTNQLVELTDALTLAGASDQDGLLNDISGTSMSYSYDEIGNLKEDLSEGITNISWNVSGKIEKVTYNTGTELAFQYDAAGNRVLKIVNADQDELGREYHHYINDASGNQMAVFKETFEVHSAPDNQYCSKVEQMELPLYGSSRLGVLNNDVVSKTYFCATLSGQFSSLPGDCNIDVNVQAATTYMVNSSSNVLLSINGLTPFLLYSEEAMSFSSPNTAYAVISGEYTQVGNRIDIAANKPVWIMLNNASEVYAISSTAQFYMRLDNPNNIHGSVKVTGGTTISTVNSNPFEPSRNLRQKQYELPNHLGNVLATVSDHRQGWDTDSDNLIDAFTPLLESSSDYYPFGSLMPGRNATSNDYRYGFNGMEKDDEIKNITGSSYDFGARIYDPRVARWMSTDPLSGKFPGVSPYNYALNNPIYNMDSDGEEAIGYIGADGKLYIVATYSYVSEGAGSFSDAEIEILEQATATMFGNAKGMLVDIDGKQYEVGSVQIKFEAGGDAKAVGAARDASFGTNALIKAPTKSLEVISKAMTGQSIPKEMAALTVGVDQSSNSTGINNTTYIKASVFDGSMIDEVREFYDNAGLEFQDGGDIGNVINDEAGHQLGGEHDYDNIPEPDGYKYGNLEQSNFDEKNKLQLDRQDIQNYVNSKEFKLVNKPKEK